jgi:uncharacterized protein Yka (UPF0111/DUF47 family)
MVDMTSKHWFLPESVDLLGMLGAQAVMTQEGMQALVAWSRGDREAALTVRECEHRADEAKRELWRALRDSYSPPIDAEDLFMLSADLDEVLNAAKDLVREMEVMGMEPDPPIATMTGYLAEAVGHLATAFEHLGPEGAATDDADAAIKSQRRVEHAYRSAMSGLLSEHHISEVIGRREAYRRLSRIGDLVHRVAERVWYAVVKEA